MRVEITEQARQRLHEIAVYLEENAPEYCDHVLLRLRTCMMSLNHSPNRGAPMKTIGNPDVRELYEMSYRIAYLVEGDAVFILTVEHMKQRRSRLKRQK